MVDAEEDVLHAEPKVGSRHLRRAGRRLDDERWPCRREPGDLRAALEALHPDEHVGQGRREPGDVNGTSGQPTLARDGPPLGEGMVQQPAVWRRDTGAPGRELDVEREPLIIPRAGTLQSTS